MNSVEIVMPRLSDSMEEGTILEWLKDVGDSVAVGEDLVEVETDKATMAYPSDTAGVLAEILVPVGATVPVGRPIATIATTANSSGVKTPAPVEKPPADESPSQRAPKRSAASPLARKIARELRVDLSTVAGSGPHGRIVKADVEKAGRSHDKPTTDQPGVERTPLTGQADTARERTVVEPTRSQATVARRMAESKARVPHFYAEIDVTMDAAADLRRGLKQVTEHPPTFNDMIVKASASALREVPEVNGSWQDGVLERFARVNVGVAVSTDDSLIVPVIRDADRKSLGEIARETSSLVSKARSGHMKPADVSGGTFTVSNLGMYGVTKFAAIVNPPQAAILAVGTVRRVPAVDTETNAFTTKLSVTLTLSCDHRAVYGTTAARFLGAVRDRLELPTALTL